MASRKHALDWTAIGEALDTIQRLCRVEPVTIETHERARSIAARYRFAFYDCAIIAAALLGGCDVLYSEDLQDGQLIEGRLTIRNPFI